MKGRIIATIVAGGAAGALWIPAAIKETNEVEENHRFRFLSWSKLVWDTFSDGYSIRDTDQTIAIIIQ
jgi:hypothetical protein